ncbi:unnamed protein product [Chironomus riparius]|uniref:Amino acid transporter transmembrane domain-containing protein n=1 Tax=Chironomus riparius TaxID=315576 RepID=A0A9N9WLL5_9DIPT|nr:unnamed protein product [Chironomus riparius]
MSSNDVQTLANSIIGTSILAMPYCFAKCGVILSILLLILSTIITRKCCHYLIKASIVTRRKNMELLGFYIFGNSGKTLVEISIIGFLMGTCIAFFVVIGDLCPLLIQKLFNLQNYNHYALRNWLIIAITILFIIPLSFLKNIQSLSFVCKASIGFYIILTFKTILESFSRFKNDENWSSNIELWNTENILQCLPIFSMAMSCQMQLFEVYENITSFDRIRQNIFHATSICLVVYTVIGFFGYVAFYNQTLSGNVLLNFTPSFSTDIITLGFIMSLACSFPLVIFPCRTSLASLIYRKVHHSDISPYVPESKYKPLTIFIIISTMFVGILIPSVEVVIGFVGSTIGVLICMIFPAICFVKIMQRHSSEKVIAQAIIVVGFVIMILGTYSNLSALDTAKSGSHIEVKVPVLNIPNEPVPLLHPKDVQRFQNDQPVLAKEVPIIPLAPIKNISEETIQKPAIIPEIKKADEEVKISEDGIRKEEQEIAADIEKAPLEPLKNPEQEIKEKDNEIKELKASKDKLEKEVHEMKEELVKQNQETQQLVLKKFDEIAEKVEKIEKQSNDGKEDAKKPVPIETRDNIEEEHEHDIKHENLVIIQNEPIQQQQAELKSENLKKESSNAEELHAKDLNVAKETDKINDTPLEKIHKPIDPIVKLIKDQEPLSYRVGEKMMEEKKHNLSISVEKDGNKHIENVELSKLQDEKQLDDMKPLEPEKHDVEVSEKDKSSHENRDEIHEDLKNEMRKKRDTDGLNELLKLNPIDLQFKSIISRDLKAVKDEAR